MCLVLVGSQVQVSSWIQLEITVCSVCSVCVCVPDPVAHLMGSSHLTTPKQTDRLKDLRLCACLLCLDLRDHPVRHCF